MKKSNFTNKKVLITGNTGFKGSWLCEILINLGAEIVGYSTCTYRNAEIFNVLDHNNRIKQYEGDVRDFNNLSNCIEKEKPDFIFHLAAQSLVGESYLNPVETFGINIMGCINIICSLKEYAQKCSCVIVTSDKCYMNNEWVYGYREIDKLGGIDPYSASKAAAEVTIEGLISSYKELFLKNEISISTVRAGNVVGGGDWSKNRLIPDIIKSWVSKSNVEIRNPSSTRPWQHVLDPLRGYLILAEKMYYENKGSFSSFNFGPNLQNIVTVEFIVEYISKRLNLEYTVKRETNRFKESSFLSLNCEKAKSELDWEPVLSISECLNMTSDWYISWRKDKKNIKNFTKKQIDYVLQN